MEHDYDKSILKNKDKRCIYWTGLHDPNGYALLDLDGDLIRADAIGYKMYIDSDWNPEDPKLTLLHACGKPGCVCPFHMIPAVLPSQQH